MRTHMEKMNCLAKNISKTSMMLNETPTLAAVSTKDSISANSPSVNYGMIGMSYTSCSLCRGAAVSASMKIDGKTIWTRR